MDLPVLRHDHLLERLGSLNPERIARINLGRRPRIHLEIAPARLVGQHQRIQRPAARHLNPDRDGVAHRQIGRTRGHGHCVISNCAVEIRSRAPVGQRQRLHRLGVRDDRDRLLFVSLHHPERIPNRVPTTVRRSEFNHQSGRDRADGQRARLDRRERDRNRNLGIDGVARLHAPVLPFHHLADGEPFGWERVELKPSEVLDLVAQVKLEFGHGRFAHVKLLPGQMQFEKHRPRVGCRAGGRRTRPGHAQSQGPRAQLLPAHLDGHRGNGIVAGLPGSERERVRHG